jgi:uncharacterized protein YeaO (DUF488 family)
MALELKPLDRAAPLHQGGLELLKRKAKEETVTLLCGARNGEHNEALVLKEILEGRKR